MIEPGDKVVCISERNPCCGTWDSRDGVKCPQPVRGRYYVVGASGWGKCNRCGVVMPCLSPVGSEHEPWAWPQPNFRKVDGATDDIFRLADVPVKEDA